LDAKEAFEVKTVSFPLHELDAAEAVAVENRSLKIFPKGIEALVG
jgi:hypothetical protein